MPTPSHSRPLPVADKNRPWDASAARKRIARWASSDRSGRKETINWSKYGKAFGYYSKGAKNFGDFKYPHHDIIGGKLVLVPRGVYAAAVRHSQYGGPAEIGIHLNAHYRRDLKEEPPGAKAATLTPYELTDRDIDYKTI